MKSLIKESRKKEGQRQTGAYFKQEGRAKRGNEENIRGQRERNGNVIKTGVK